jgi:hypothetical protein
VDFNITAGGCCNALGAAVVLKRSTDFTPLFNWNTKQIFIYLQAEYNSTLGVRLFSSYIEGCPADYCCIR